MNRSVVGWLAAALLAVAGASFAWLFWFAGGSGEPTTELTTPELSDTITTSTVTESSSSVARPDTTEPEQQPSTLTFEIDQS